MISNFLIAKRYTYISIYTIEGRTITKPFGSFPNLFSHILCSTCLTTVQYRDSHNVLCRKKISSVCLLIEKELYRVTRYRYVTNFQLLHRDVIGRLADDIWRNVSFTNGVCKLQKANIIVFSALNVFRIW